MKIAIISDIHGNMEAFKEVLSDMELLGVTDVICLGDVIGYGPEPDETVRTIKELGIPSVIGNHELAVLDRSQLKWFNPLARTSLLKTIELLSDESMEHLWTMKSFLVAHGGRFVHGFPPDSVTTYLFQVLLTRLLWMFKRAKEKISFIGHTHELEMIECKGSDISCKRLEEGTVKLYDNRKYLINVGSVGQPRDGDNRAKYIIWDKDKEIIRVRFVPYDIESVTKKIIDAGLPKSHANRLW